MVYNQYNQKRHIELLKYSQDLNNQGKNIWVENKEESHALNIYNALIYKHIFWQHRNDVALLMENFLNKKIDGDLFCDEVYGLRNKTLSAYKKFISELISSSENMKEFQPDPKCERIKGFSTYLFTECQCFNDEDNYPLYDSIQNGYLNFQEAINKE